jgi:hypothetical protein
MISSLIRLLVVSVPLLVVAAGVLTKVIAMSFLPTVIDG